MAHSPMAQAQDNSEAVYLHMAESAVTMASTDYWKLLVQVLVNDETNSLIALENYLAEGCEREQIVTLCLRWYALRRQRRLLLDNVREARLRFVPQPPLSDEAKSILLEYGEQYGNPGNGSATERG